MSEAELIHARLGTLSVILTILSMMFTLVSAYLAGLNYFLGRSPLPIKLTAFALVSLGFLFLGGITFSLQPLHDGVLVAWELQTRTATGVPTLRPSPLPTGSIEVQSVGKWLGWSFATIIYLALFYLTFVFDWDAQSESKQSKR